MRHRIQRFASRFTFGLAVGTILCAVQLIIMIALWPTPTRGVMRLVETAEEERAVVMALFRGRKDTA